MALRSADRIEIQNLLAAGAAEVPWDKPTINAAMDAIETEMKDTAIPALSSAIDTATSPLVLTGPQKAKLFRSWAFNHFNRG
jgi:hypothetical protein